MVVLACENGRGPNPNTIVRLAYGSGQSQGQRQWRRVDDSPCGRLRKQIPTNPSTVGVVWYLVPDETHNSDGKHVHYLDPSAYNQERYRDCDPTLYDTLREIVRSNRRSVSSIRDWPSVTLGYSVFYEAALELLTRPDNQKPLRPGSTGSARRKAWLHERPETYCWLRHRFRRSGQWTRSTGRPLPATRPQVCLFRRIVTLSGEGPESGYIPPPGETGLGLGSNSRAIDPNKE